MIQYIALRNDKKIVQPLTRCAMGTAGPALADIWLGDEGTQMQALQRVVVKVIVVAVVVVAVESSARMISGEFPWRGARLWQLRSPKDTMLQRGEFSYHMNCLDASYFQIFWYIAV